MGNTDLTLQWSKLLPLTEDNLTKFTLEKVSGVFRISKKEIDGRFYVVFVGSTVDLKTELNKLLKDVNFSEQAGEFSFRYAPLSDEAMQKAVEKQMYKQYAPKLNQTEPQSTLDIKVNLN